MQRILRGGVRDRQFQRERSIGKDTWRGKRLVVHSDRTRDEGGGRGSGSESQVSCRAVLVDIRELSCREGSA